MRQAESVLPRGRIAYNRRMKILLNGAEREVAASTSLAELLEQAGYGARRVAVEVNREIIPRSRHAAQRLDDGDRIEIVHAIGGG
jgi:sulfur carrier protein